MLISQVPKNPLNHQSLLQLQPEFYAKEYFAHLTPDDVVSLWDKVKVLKARTVETANPGVSIQVLNCLLQEVLVLLQQVYSLKVLKGNHAKKKPRQIDSNCVTLVKRCFVILPIPAPQSRALALPGPPSTLLKDQ